MYCEDENVADQMYRDMTENSSSKEIAYLRHLQAIQHKYVEAWIASHRNLGISTTQRAESMNHTLKKHLGGNAPMIALLKALWNMTKSREEMRAFREFEMTDKPKVYSSLVSLVQGKVSRYLLDLLEEECGK